MATSAVLPLDLLAWVDSHLERFGQSAFRIISQSRQVVYIDPYESPTDPKPADVVLITHGHPDHFQPEVVKNLSKRGTRVVVPTSTKEAGLDYGLATDAMAPGESKQVGFLPVTAVAAYNTSKPFHPRRKAWVGYLFEIDGVRIYHAGDTDFIPEMKGLGVDVALLPVGGLFTMGKKEALQAAEALQPQVVVPMHYGRLPFTGGAGRAFARAWSGLSVVLDPQR